MSAAANKKLVQQIYADSASRSGTTFADHLAEALLLGRQDLDALFERLKLELHGADTDDAAEAGMRLP